MNKPEFFIIGAPKCGTTSLYSWLKEHPDLFMPQAKEPHYFAQNLSNRYCRVRNEAAYLNLFKDAKGEQKCGEASVLYGFYPQSIQKILEFNPRAKIIYMVRNPIEMAPSYHGQLLVNLEEDVSDFEKAWNLQPERVLGRNLPKTSTDAPLLQYSGICALGRHLRDIAAIVPKDQLKVILLNDLAASPEKIYKQALAFLEVQDDNRTQFKPANEAAAIQSKLLQKIRTSHSPLLKINKNILKKIMPATFIEAVNRKRRRKIILSKEFKKELQRVFEADIKIIEEYLERDLSDWRNVE